MNRDRRNVGVDRGQQIRVRASDEAAAYDALPRELRRVLAEAPLNCSALKILGEWEFLRRQGVAVEWCAAELRRNIWGIVAQTREVWNV